MKNLSVMAIPAKENQKDNPYNYILYSSMEQQGVQVSGYSLRKFLKVSSYDVVHFHWPENYLNGKSTTGACKAAVVFFAKLLFLKICRRKVVWTVHNFAPHESRNAFVQKLFYRLLYKRMDGYISLTAYGKNEIIKNRLVPTKKTTVISHPHYIGYYPNTISRTEARKKLGIPEEKFVFLFIGQVRAYKNVTGLVKAFRRLKDKDAVLLIAGKVHPEMADELSKEVDGDERIKMVSSFIADADLQIYLNSADLVVNPFQKILNSGSVFLNLSFSKPTLVPAAPSLQELQQQIGAAWIKTYEGSLTSDHLQQAIITVKQNDMGMKPDLSSFEWNHIALQTKKFYKQLIAS